MTNPKIIFAGTPEFALASLHALVAADFVPCAVLTQPDRPAGRGKQLTASPVKQYALEQNIPVMQPATMRDDAIVAELAALQPDILVVAAYGLILPESVLEIPRAGCLNVHASLLPRWRGAAPIQAAILAGDEKTGVCLMSMQAGLDCGPVYKSEAVTIGEEETAGELHDRLAHIGAELLVTHIDAIVAGELTAIAQDEQQASYAPKVKTRDAAIDWKQPSQGLQRLVRAYNPVPGAWFMLEGERLKCWRAGSVAAADVAPGTIVAAGQDGIVVSCGEGCLRLDALQRPGKRVVTAGEFAAQMDLVGLVL